MPTIRHEINIINREAGGASGIVLGADGYVKLFPSNYGGINQTLTYYFEVQVTTASAASTVTLRYFGTTSDIASIATTSTGLLRSASFAGGEYTYGIYSADTTVRVKSARIIVMQSASVILVSGVNIELGGAGTTTSTTGVPITNPKYWKYDASQWPSKVFAQIRGSLYSASSKSSSSFTLQVADGTGDGFTGWSDVTNSTASTTSTTMVEVGSDIFQLVAGRNYRIKVTSGSSKTAMGYANAKLVVVAITAGLVGNNLRVPTWGYIPSVTTLSTTRIACTYAASTNVARIVTYDFDGTDWAQVGNQLNISAASAVCCSLSSTRIAVAITASTDGGLRTYDFDGTDWASVGNLLTITGHNGRKLVTKLSATRIAYRDDQNRSLRTYDFDGTDWAQVGNSLTIGGTFAYGPVALSSTRVAYPDQTNLITYDFDGTDWAQVGNSLSTGYVGCAAVGISDTRVAFSVADGGYATFRCFDFDGTNWTKMMEPLIPTHSGAANSRMSATFLSGTTFAVLAVANRENLAEPHHLWTCKAVEQFTLSFEEQYLLNNTLVAAGTGFQNALTTFDKSEWVGVSNQYVACADAANGSTSVITIQEADGGSTIGTVTSPDNQGFGTAIVDMPPTQNLDAKLTTNNNDVYATRLLVRCKLGVANDNYGNIASDGHMVRQAVNRAGTY